MMSTYAPAMGIPWWVYVLPHAQTSLISCGMVSYYVGMSGGEWMVLNTRIYTPLGYPYRYLYNVLERVYTGCRPCELWPLLPVAVHPRDVLTRCRYVVYAWLYVRTHPYYVGRCGVILRMQPIAQGSARSYMGI